MNHVLPAPSDNVIERGAHLPRRDAKIHAADSGAKTGYGETSDWGRVFTVVLKHRDQNCP